MMLSKSKINTYLKCPRSFKYQYIDKIRPIEPELDSPLEIGNSVHDIFEKTLKENNIDFLKALSLDELQNFIQAKYDIELRFEDHIKNFAKFLKEIFTNGYEILGVEVFIKNEQLNIHGYLDLILKKDGKLTIIDYKTSKKPKGISNYELELAYYGFMAQEYFKVPVEQVGIYFSKIHKFRFSSFLIDLGKGAFLSKEDVYAAIDYLFFVHRCVQNEVYPYRKGFLCKYCDYNLDCKEEGYSEYGVFR